MALLGVAMKLIYNFAYLFHYLFLTLLVASCATPSLNVERTPASGTSAYEKSCSAALGRLFSGQDKLTQKDKVPWVKTKIEAELAALPPQSSLDDQLSAAIVKIKESDPALAAKIEVALTKKEKKGAHALRVDLSDLQAKMVNFLEGPYFKIAGERGLSEPFVRIEMVDSDTLFIFHAGDKYPLLIKWSDDFEPKVALQSAEELLLENTSRFSDRKTFQVLYLPREMKSKEELKFLEVEIYELISGSRINRYIASKKSPISIAAAIIHDGRLMSDRPTQVEFNQLRERLNSDGALRQMIRSLLFVAPTATGKTRILGNNIVSKITQATKLLSGGNKKTKKLSVLMANTPDLVNQLALDIGEQLHLQLGPSQYRVVQWGGLQSEDMGIEKLMAFVEKSDVPVLLVTSTQTIASRVKSDDEIKKLFRLANSISIDEAHNSQSNTFKRVMNVGLEIGAEDRQSGRDVLESLDILGVTASPLSRTERTTEVFERTYWGSLDSPGRFAQRVKESSGQERSSTATDVLEWIKIEQQYQNARGRGEITSPKRPFYFDAREQGFNFDSIFARAASGTQPNVNVEKLKAIWPFIESKILGHGPGVIHAYPRDAENIAKTLSELSGKNYVSLTKLSDNKRDAVLNAFKNGTLYEGAPVDAIVGRIKEGLDFPRAGWYLSFKKYVRFPENLQGQGRVVRIDLDKPTPAIIYFGENMSQLAFRDVKELVLAKLGRLPRRLDEGRGFSGARIYQKTHPQSELGASTLELNTSLEVLFRQNKKLSYEYLDKDESLSADAVGKFQKLLSNALRQHGNLEVYGSVKEFIHQINGYTFFQGTLSDTWKYCDKLLSIQKKGAPYPKNLGAQELGILKDAAEMEKVAEFRAMRSWIGSVSREVLENMPLGPSGVVDLAASLDALVARYGDDSIAAIERWTFGKNFKEALSVSAEAIWDRLSYRARVGLETLFDSADEKPITESLNDYFAHHQELPKFYFYKLDSEEAINLEDKISHRLAEKLEAYLQTGKLNLEQLDIALLEELDRSQFFAKIVGQVISALISEIGKASGEMNEAAVKNLGVSFEDLTKYEAFGSFKILEELSNRGLVNSVALKAAIEKLLGG